MSFNDVLFIAGRKIQESTGKNQTNKKISHRSGGKKLRRDPKLSVPKKDAHIFFLLKKKYRKPSLKRKEKKFFEKFSRTMLL